MSPDVNSHSDTEKVKPRLQSHLPRRPAQETTRKPNKSSRCGPTWKQQLQTIHSMASASPEKKKTTKTEGSEKKYPPTSQLMVEALKQTEDKNGLTVRGIQAYVGRTFPELLDRPGFHSRLKKSVLKGLETGTLKRPKKSQDSPGVTGYFKLGDKAKTEEKVKKPKARSTSPAEAKKARVKKPKAVETKSVKARSRSRSKSPFKAKAPKPTKKTASPKVKKATPKKAAAGEKKATAKKAITKKVATAKAAAKKPTKPKTKPSA